MPPASGSIKRGNTINDQSQTSPRGASQPQFRARPERIAIGKNLRQQIPREQHAEWKPRSDRRDPIAVLEESNHDRLPELIPIRYGRMLRSPFTFLRGSAALMAYDLADTPSIGVQVQACGDCHLLNFGLFATPERNLVFDLNDFDETHPAPWEWDLKSLVTSVVIAGRDLGLTDDDSETAVSDCVRRYLSALLSAQGGFVEHLCAAYCFLLFMGHELMNGAASQSPLGGGCVGP